MSGGHVKDITGMTFGRLTAVRVCGFKERANGYRSAVWLFECSCGATTEAIGCVVRSGGKRSCGCLHREQIVARNKDRGYGFKRHPLHRTWGAMRSRCHNPNVPSYPDYGGRGIKVCARWDDFAAFAEDMGQGRQVHRSTGLTWMVITRLRIADGQHRRSKPGTSGTQLCLRSMA